MASIDLIGVTKRFGQHTALRSLDLSARDGELLALLGASGSGKTTLLCIAAGLERPDEGRVRLGGVDVTDHPPAARDVAMVFQSLALYPHLTVRGNLMFGARLRREPRAESAARLEEVARSLQIEPFLDRRPDSLSGGERQRVALAKAMMRSPCAWLFDEPFSSLDPALRLDLRRRLRAVQCESPTTTIYVTHDEDEARSLGDRVAILHGGKIVQVGTSSDLYARPKFRAVAAALGAPAINFASGSIEDRGGDRAFVAPGWSCTLDPSTPLSGSARAVTLGVRPEDASLTVDESRALFRGEVTSTRRLGAQEFVEIEGPSGLVWTVSLEPDQAAGRGDHVGVAVDRSSVYLFDEEGEQRSILDRGEPK